MRGGIWVLNVFAAAWGVAGILVGRLPAWLAILPIALSAVLLAWARRQPIGAGDPVEGDHVGRIVGTASAIEGIAMFIAANVLIDLRLPTLVMPVFALIVGLHFLPLARWIPVSIYYWTGAALIAVGLIATALPSDDRAIATGIASAVILWASGLRLTRGGHG